MKALISTHSLLHLTRSSLRDSERISVFITLAALLCVASLGLCVSACDDDSSSESAQAELRYDLEGPRGIVRERGPWLAIRETLQEVPPGG